MNRTMSRKYVQLFKKGLFLAMDIADIWLNRALAGKM